MREDFTAEKESSCRTGRKAGPEVTRETRTGDRTADSCWGPAANASAQHPERFSKNLPWSFLPSPPSAREARIAAAAAREGRLGSCSASSSPSGPV